MGFSLLHAVICYRLLFTVVGFTSCFNCYKPSKYSVNINQYNKVTIHSQSTTFILFSTKPDMNWDPKTALKLDFTEDYYKVLEIPPTIPQKDLKKSYYKLVFSYHPDNKRTDKEKELSNKQMMVINNAYKILKDESLRAKYDIQRKNGLFGSNARVKTATVNNSESTTTDNSATSSATKSAADAKSSQYKSSSADTKTRTSNSYYNNNKNNVDDDFDEDKMWETFRGYVTSPKDSTPQSNQRRVSDDEQKEQSFESFGDLLTDMWSDISMDGGKHFVNDLLEFLETQTPLSSVTGSSSINSNIYHTNNNVADRESEINMLQNTVKSLESHIQEMTKERASMNLTGGTSSTINNTQQQQQLLEDRLRLLETARGLDARIFEAKKQMRQLQDKLRRTLSTTTSSSSASSNNTNSNPSPQQAQPKRNVIDEDMADNYSSSYFKTDTGTPPTSSSSSSQTQSSNNSNNNKSTTSSTSNNSNNNNNAQKQQSTPNTSSSNSNKNINNSSNSNSSVLSDDKKAMREILVEDELMKLKLKLSKNNK